MRFKLLKVSPFEDAEGAGRRVTMAAEGATILLLTRNPALISELEAMKPTDVFMCCVAGNVIK